MARVEATMKERKSSCAIASGRGTTNQSSDAFKALSLYFPGRPVQSNTISTSLGSIQQYAIITVRRLLVGSSTAARYLFKQLSELEQRGVKKPLFN